MKKTMRRKPLLLHAELDRLDRVGRIDRIVLRLVGVDQRREHVEAVAFARARFGSPQALDLLERVLVVGLRADRLYLSGHVAPL